MTHSALADIQQSLIECRRCERLVEWRETVAETKRASFADETYWGRPVPLFGDATSRLLIVGLAPAAHGANRTGRMFTGDRSGDWLFRAMHRAGFATQAEAMSVDDGLQVVDASITAVARCAPPDNKPLTSELNNCRYWLEAELDVLEHVRVVICLGGISFDRTLRVLRDRGRSVPSPKPKFAHGVEVTVDDWTIIGSYHPSQQNTFTGRLTEVMLDAVFARARELIDR